MYSLNHTTNKQVSVLTQLYIYVFVLSYVHALQIYEVYINGRLQNISYSKAKKASKTFKSKRLIY
jgi:hypothetical protein